MVFNADDDVYVDGDVDHGNVEDDESDDGDDGGDDGDDDGADGEGDDDDYAGRPKTERVGVHIFAETRHVTLCTGGVGLGLGGGCDNVL